MKTGLEELNGAFLNYQSCYSSYYEKLTSEEDQDYKSNRYLEKEISIHDYESNRYSEKEISIHEFRTGFPKLNIICQNI